MNCFERKSCFVFALLESRGKHFGTRQLRHVVDRGAQLL
jgi:hypothetical protein